MSQSFPPPPEPTSSGQSWPQGRRDPTVVVYRDQKSGLPAWAWVLIIFVSVAGVLCIAICGGLVWLGARGPDIAVVPGRQVPARFQQEIRDPGLLEDDERITYFYSDAMLDIKKGMYFFTDRRVVIYSEDLAPPEIIVPFEQIEDIYVEFSDSWMIDGTIYLLLDDDTEVWFPISAAGEGDRKFYDALVAAWERRKGE